jgi:hypothetical protein
MIIHTSKAYAHKGRRPGTILPLVVISLVGVCGFVALAIDIGMIAVAKTQCQNAADAAAMAGARSLDGTASQNLGAVGQTGTAMDNAMVIAQANLVLSTVIPQSDITLTPGSYHYDSTNQKFVPLFPANGQTPTAPDNYNLMQVTITFDVHTTFAPAFGFINKSFNPIVAVTATSIGAHRPRDTAMILDFSGSMNNESDLWNNENYLDTGSTTTTNFYRWPQSGNPNFTSNNTETVFPLFGHYANTTDYTNYPNYANLLCPSGDSANTSGLYQDGRIGKCNISISVDGVSATVGDFYQSSLGITPVASAFTSAPDNFQYGNDTTDTYTDAQGKSWTGQGDNYLPKNGKPITAGATATPAGNIAATVNDVIGGTAGTSVYNSNFETQGYKSITGNNFNGYQVGPRYWGKTFFMWPPDPTNDWRTKFFFKSDGTTPCNDNTLLFKNAYPGFNDPAGNYVINYKAILNWIKNTGPNPFPSQLRGGYVSYWSSIPTDVPAAAYNHSTANTNISWPDDQTRFWKEYIDFVLGVWRDPNSNIQRPQTPTCSYGPDYMFPTTASIKISAPPSGSSNVPYMNYDDNPWRPRHRFWFGPMTMVQFMQDTGLLPGTAHDISMFPMKQGVAAGLNDIQNNHPNDRVSVLLFSRPQYHNDSPGTGAFNRPLFNLTNDYIAMQQQIWLSPAGKSDVTPWSTDGLNVPRAHGDYDNNTASSYGFMLAYNQYSAATVLQGNQTDGLGPVGGFGRKGATKLVIYETDGMANQGTDPTGGKKGFVNNGPYQSYYAILPGDTINATGYTQKELTDVVQAICNLDSDKTPGFATPNRPAIVQCIAFGAIFESPNTVQTNAVALLQDISTIGGTVFPSSATDPTNGWKWCIGTLAERQSKLQKAFVTILDSSVPVSLIK